MIYKDGATKQPKWPRSTWSMDGDVLTGHVLSLITAAELATLPVGTVLVSITGRRVKVGDGNHIDDDTRFGFLAYGFDLGDCRVSR